MLLKYIMIYLSQISVYMFLVFFLIYRLYIGIICTYWCRLCVWKYFCCCSNLEYCKVQSSCAQINLNLGYCKITIKGCLSFKGGFYLQRLYVLIWILLKVLVINCENLYSVSILWILIPPLCTYEHKCCNLTAVHFCVCS